MSASADVLAQAKVEVDLNTIPEGKNVRILQLMIQTLAYRANRSLSNGEESPSSSDTELRTRLKKPTRPSGNLYEIPSQIPIASRSLNG